MSVPDYLFTTPEDAGRYFRLVERNGLWFDSAPPANPADRGSTNFRRRWYEQHSRFQIIQPAHATKAARVDSKAYEVLIFTSYGEQAKSLRGQNTETTGG